MSVGGDVPADVGVGIGLHDHGHGVPADDALDARLDAPVAGIGRLLFGGNGVEVGRMRGGGNLDAGVAEAGDEVIDEESGVPGVFVEQRALDDVLEGLEPATRVGGVGRSGVVGGEAGIGQRHRGVAFLRFYFVSHNALKIFGKSFEPVRGLAPYYLRLPDTNLILFVTGRTYDDGQATVHIANLSTHKLQSFPNSGSR